MLNIGFSELLLFGIIALVILGPEKLPTAVRTAGRWYARLRHLVSNLQQDIEKELQLAELREHMQQELARIKTIEAQMQAQLDQMSDELAELNQSPTAPSVLASASIYLPITLPLTQAMGAPYTIGHLLRLALVQQYQLAPDAQHHAGAQPHNGSQQPQLSAVIPTEAAL
ncbi:twin arginine-targeting protein translocase TatB [Alkanindiges hydrocarboniclasticus]|uniref:Sec-independent protein translocase protein TatB n=1 Tax=Alkanindiges hydrocarboniclasticus TaxID=1907941 RepID=A0A1S8D094_9GAMM|nr:Sec-independent protein translocase protein TatB [Alkanindiges hydrocarboniclasticus]ONG42153.1 twin arginine-targeting protein translocase TatB [Alkanindiges hydrocarboniclasticus]